MINPADFHQVMIPLIDVFVTSSIDEPTLAAIVEEIFAQVLLVTA